MSSIHNGVRVHRFAGGIHPQDGKALSSGGTVQTAPLLEKYRVVIQQNIGAPPQLLVKKDDAVRKSPKHPGLCLCRFMLRPAELSETCWKYREPTARRFPRLRLFPTAGMNGVKP